MVAELVEPLLALDAPGQCHLARPQPGLRFARAIVARRHDCGGGDQGEQQDRAAPHDQVRYTGELLPVFLA